MSLSDELKPCPFCGAQPTENAIEPHRHHFCGLPDHPGSHVIECGCGAGLIDDTREKVVARWNTRAIERAATIAAMRRCAEIAERYGPDRPIVSKNPSNRVFGRWEGEQAASQNIGEEIRAEIARLEAEK